MSAVDSEPRVEYTYLLKARENLAKQLSRTSSRISWLRFAIAAAAAIVAWKAVVEVSWDVVWLLLPIIVFLIVATLHERVERRRKRAEAGATFYRAGVARIDDDWAGHGPSGERFSEADHLYSSDLDLFGSGSLFQLLATVPNPGGAADLSKLAVLGGVPPGDPAAAGGGGGSAGETGSSRRSGDPRRRQRRHDGLREVQSVGRRAYETEHPLASRGCSPPGVGESGCRHTLVSPPGRLLYLTRVWQRRLLRWISTTTRIEYIVSVPGVLVYRRGPSSSPPPRCAGPGLGGAGPHSWEG